ARASVAKSTAAAAATLAKTLLLMDRSPLETDERADTRIGIAEHVAPERALGADEHLPPLAAEACVDLLPRFVIRGAVILVVELPIRSFERPERGLPGYSREHAACANAVPEHAPIRTPVAEHMAVVGQPVAVDPVNVPTVLPLRELQRRRQIGAELRERDTRRQSRITEPQVVGPGSVLAGVLEIDGHWQGIAEHELRRERCGLVAEVATRCRAGIVESRGIEERLDELAQRVLTLAAAVLHDATHTDRPARKRLDGQMQARHSRLARGGAAAEGDVGGLTG